MQGIVPVIDAYAPEAYINCRTVSRQSSLIPALALNGLRFVLCASMSTGNECQILSNPDIDGVGIRTSLYAQAAISLILYTLAPDSTVFDSWWSTLVTALSLQLAAFSNHSTISLFHAILVTWLSFPAIITSFSFYGLYRGPYEAPLVLLLLSLAHIYSFLSFALWVWATAPTFPCPNLVHVIVFGHRIRVTGWFRYIVLAILGFWATGITITLLVGGLTYVYAWFTDRTEDLFRQPETHSQPETPDEKVARVYGSVAFALGFTIFGIVMAELMIATHDIVPQDSKWGFGQIAALILLMTPVFTLIRIIREDYIGTSSKPLAQRPPAALWRMIRDRKGDNMEEAQGSTDPDVRVSHEVLCPSRMSPNEAEDQPNSTSSRNSPSSLRSRPLDTTTLAIFVNPHCIVRPPRSPPLPLAPML